MKTICLIIPGAVAVGALYYTAIHFINVAQGVTP